MATIQGFTKFSITTDIRKLLLDNEDLKALVNTNIFPINAPEETDGNCIFYYRDKSIPEYTMNDIIINYKAVVTYAIRSDDYDESIEIVELANKIINGTHLNKDGYKYNCKLIESAEDLIDKKYFQILQFEIK